MISDSILKIANELSLSSFIVDFKYGFIFFSVLKDRSAEQFDTGQHKNIRNAISIYGYKLDLLRSLVILFKSKKLLANYSPVTQINDHKCVYIH